MSNEERDEEYAIELFRSLLDSLESDRRHKAQDLSLLVHFTSFLAFENILGRKEIWHSPVKTMNDFNEVSWGKQLIVQEADYPNGKLLSAIDPIRVNHEELWNEISDEFNARLDFDTDETFVSCWSQYDRERLSDGREQFDDLSMWRAYGGSGNGVALIFDPVALTRHSFFWSGVSFAPVEYQSQEAFIERAHRAFSDFSLKVMAMPESDRNVYSNEIVNAFAELAFYLSVTHKHTAFKGEREWRSIWNRKPWSPDALTDEVSARRSGSGIFEKLVMRFGHDGFGSPDEVKLSDALLAVMIGPCENRDLKHRGVANLLRENGLEQTEVLVSPIPFRA